MPVGYASLWAMVTVMLIGVCPSGSQVITDHTKCPEPRVRRGWSDLTSKQQFTFLKALDLLKQNKELPYPGAKAEMRSYDVFVLVHSHDYNTNFAHGQLTHFLVWHRYYLWQLETALREMITQYNQVLLKNKQTSGLLDACISLPYWDWENYVNNETSSLLFNSSGFGSPSPSCVPDGLFAKWITTNGTCLSRNFTNYHGGVRTGPAQMLNGIVSKPLYQDFSEWIQGQPHGDVHNYINGAMSTMSSPDDPLFWTHHTNLDRYFAMWQDCWDYEKIAPKNLTSTQFFPTMRVYPPSGSFRQRFTMQTPMPYYIGNFSIPNRFNCTPSTEQAYGMGWARSKGINGMYYRYGPDKLLQAAYATFGNICRWDSWVDYDPAVEFNRRAILQSNGNYTDRNWTLFGSAGHREVIRFISMRFSRSTAQQRIHYLTLWECAYSNMKNRGVVPYQWLRMNNQDPSKSWLTQCEMEGRTDGYMQLAMMENGELGGQAESDQIVIIVVGVLAGVVVIGIIAALVVWCHWSQKKDLVETASSRSNTRSSTVDLSESLLQTSEGSFT